MRCDGSRARQWITSLAPSRNDVGTIRSVYSRLFLDVNGNSPWAGASIGTWSDNNRYNQEFAVVDRPRRGGIDEREQTIQDWEVPAPAPALPFGSQRFCCLPERDRRRVGPQ